MVVHDGVPMTYQVNVKPIRNGVAIHCGDFILDCTFDLLEKSRFEMTRAEDVPFMEVRCVLFFVSLCLDALFICSYS